jgi:hypothetical protein
MALDLTSAILIIFTVAAIYFIFKFIVSPIAKAILSIAILLIAIYALQKFFNFDLSQLLSPFGISFNFNLDKILNPLNNIMNQALTIINSLIKK